MLFLEPMFRQKNCYLFLLWIFNLKKYDFFLGLGSRQLTHLVGRARLNWKIGLGSDLKTSLQHAQQPLTSLSLSLLSHILFLRLHSRAPLRLNYGWTKRFYCSLASFVPFVIVPRVRSSNVSTFKVKIDFWVFERWRRRNGARMAWQQKVVGSKTATASFFYLESLKPNFYQSLKAIIK